MLLQLLMFTCKYNYDSTSVANTNKHYQSKNEIGCCFLNMINETWLCTQWGVGSYWLVRLLFDWLMLRVLKTYSILLQKIEFFFDDGCSWYGVQRTYAAIQSYHVSDFVLDLFPNNYNKLLLTTQCSHFSIGYPEIRPIVCLQAGAFIWIFGSNNEAKLLFASRCSVCKSVSK